MRRTPRQGYNYTCPGHVDGWDFWELVDQSLQRNLHFNNKSKRHAISKGWKARRLTQ
jgi:hypothetical protein